MHGRSVKNIQGRKKKIKDTQTADHENRSPRARKKKRIKKKKKDTSDRIYDLSSFEYCMKNAITLIPFLSEFRLTVFPAVFLSYENSLRDRRRYFAVLISVYFQR